MDAFHSGSLGGHLRLHCLEQICPHQDFHSARGSRVASAIVPALWTRLLGFWKDMIPKTLLPMPGGAWVYSFTC